MAHTLKLLSYAAVAACFDPSWAALADPRTWLAGLAYAAITGGGGLGVQTMLAHLRPRTAEGSAQALACLCAGALGQLVLGVGMVGAADPQAAGGMPTPGLGEGGAASLAALAAAVATLATAALAVGMVAEAVSERFRFTAETAVLASLAAVSVPAVLLTVAPAGEELPGISAALAGWVVLPLAASLGLVACWAVRLDGLQDHIAAHSGLRLGAWWPPVVGVVAPAAIGLALLAGVVGHGAAGAWGPALAVACLAPAALLALRRAGRPG